MNRQSNKQSCFQLVNYEDMMVRRQVVCEGNFALQKRCHNLRFTRFRGIENAIIQCLLSASALNLKRLVKYGNILRIPDVIAAKPAIISGIFILYEIYTYKLLDENIVKASKCGFCQQTNLAKADILWTFILVIRALCTIWVC